MQPLLRLLNLSALLAPPAPTGRYLRATGKRKPRHVRNKRRATKQSRRRNR